MGDAIGGQFGPWTSFFFDSCKLYDIVTKVKIILYFHDLIQRTRLSTHAKEGT